MLSEDQAWEIVNGIPACHLRLEGTEADVVAPVTTWLHFHVVPQDRHNCSYCRETLILWHALASCPGFGAAENPSFWMRAIRSVSRGSLSHPHPSFDRARFFPDPQQHPFPSVTFYFKSSRRPSGWKHVHGHGEYQSVATYLTRVMDANDEPRSEVLRANLERLRVPVRFSRPIPVRLQCGVPYFSIICGRYDHYVGTWAVSVFIAMIHEWLVQLPQKCTTTWSRASFGASLASPRFVVEAVHFTELHDVRVAMNRELQSLMDDPRLEHVAFPEIGLVKIHQSMRPKTVHRFLSYFLRPLSAVQALQPHPRLPQSLTLRLTNDGTDDGVGAHVELFFQLLPFTQSIRSLTLLGMDCSRQWGWLGFALFHPSAQPSQRKLTVSTGNYELAPAVLAVHLRTSSVSEFKAVVFGAMSNQEETLQCPEIGLSALPLTTISHVTVDVSMASTDPQWRHHHKNIYDLSQWAIFLLSLSRSLQQIHVKPFHQCKPGSLMIVTHATMPSADVLKIVHRCMLLKELSIPARGWTSSQLEELFTVTRLRSLELHAEVDEIRAAMQVLRGLHPRSRRHMQRLGLGILFDAFLPIEWFLFDELLDTTPSLEYLYVHMGNLNQAGFRYHFREHPPGELARQVKARNGEELQSPQQYQDEKVAFLSILHHRREDPRTIGAYFDSALVAIIFQLCVRLGRVLWAWTGCTGVTMAAWSQSKTHSRPQIVPHPLTCTDLLLDDSPSLRMVSDLDTFPPMDVEWFILGPHQSRLATRCPLRERRRSIGGGQRTAAVLKPRP